MTLKNAFSRLQETRPYARPNLAFFHQLVQYERECLGRNTVEMVDVPIESEKSESRNRRKKTKKKPGKTIVAPDFYRKDYPHLLKLEIEETANNPSLKKILSKSPLNKSKISKKSNTRAKKKSVSSSDTKSNNSHQLRPETNELKPFIIETVLYPEFIEEFEKAKKSLTYEDN